MKLLKRKYSIFWLLLSLITCNISILLYAGLLGVYEDNAWYNQWYVWVLSFLLGIVPALILFLIMLIETMVKVAKEFEIGGQNIYGYPYVWIGCLIVPVIGWTVFIIMILYLYIWYIVGLFQGKGEKYLK